MAKKPGRKSAAELATPKPNVHTLPVVLSATDRVVAPSHLEPATRRWFESVVADYTLEPHHLRLLQLAGEAWDRGQQAREAIGEHGLVFQGKDGPKPRPEVIIEKDARIAFARLIRELDLDIDPPGEERARPPSLASNRG